MCMTTLHAVIMRPAAAPTAERSTSPSTQHALAFKGFAKKKEKNLSHPCAAHVEACSTRALLFPTTRPLCNNQEGGNFQKMSLAPGGEINFCAVLVLEACEGELSVDKCSHPLFCYTRAQSRSVSKTKGFARISPKRLLAHLDSSLCRLQE
jgi:hypothetical protein